MKKKIDFRSKTPNPKYPDAGLIKITKPGYSGGVYYEKGYVRFYNDNGQPMNNPSVNTNPGSNNNTHFEFQ